MNDDQLIDKIRKNYAGYGAFRVIFFMRHRYDDPSREQQRLDKLFYIVKKTLPRKPGRILGATYTGFLENGRIYNLKGNEVFI